MTEFTELNHLDFIPKDPVLILLAKQNALLKTLIEFEVTKFCKNDDKKIRLMMDQIDSDVQEYQKIELNNLEILRQQGLLPFFDNPSIQSTDDQTSE